MASSDYHYDVFLSYTTDPDYLLARDLEDFLSRFHELPMPKSMPLKQLRIWRDETGRPAVGTGLRADVTSMLEEYLPQCRYLMLVWSTQSLHSAYQRFEFEWFRTHRGLQSILLGITDAHDPVRSVDTLFWPEIKQSGLLDQPWYDFRGFRKEGLTGFIKLRDYDDARVQLAADLNGYSPAELQPIWWRNKIREQQEKAEREEQARRRLELTECNARLEAARGWYERAFVFFEQRRYRHSSRCLLNAIAVAPPGEVPGHFPTSLSNPGWSSDGWAFLRYTLALAPRLVRSFALAAGQDALLTAGFPKPSKNTSVCWVDAGRSFAVAVQNERSEVSARLSIPRLDEVCSRTICDSIWLFNYPAGTHQAKITPPEDAGRITIWAASRHTGRVAVGTESGWLCLWSAATGRTTSFQGHSTPVTAVAFAHAGDRLASGSAQGEVRVWSRLDDENPVAHLVVARSAANDPRPANDRAETKLEEERQAVGYVGFVRNDTSIVFHRDNQLLEQPLDRPDLSVLAEFVLSGALVHDETGHKIAYADSDIVRSFEIVRSKEQPEGREEPLLFVGQHEDVILQVMFGTSDRRLLTRDMKGKLYAWLGQAQELERSMTVMEAKMTRRFGQSNRGTLLKHLEGVGTVDSFDSHPVIPDRLLVRRAGVIEEWDLGFAFEPIGGWRNAAKGSRCAAWLQDGSGVIAGFDDGSVQVFEFGVDTPARVIVPDGAAVGYLVVSRDGARVATATEDGVVRVRAIWDGTVLAEVRTPSPPFTVTFVSDEQVLAIGCADGRVLLWSWTSGLTLRRLGTIEDAVLGLAVATDTLVASSLHEVAAWDLREELQHWSTSELAHSRFSSSIGRLAVSRDGQLVVYGCIDGTVQCLQVDSGQLVSTTSVPPSIPSKPKHVTAVGISDDNRTAFAGLWDGTLCIIDLLRGRELFRFRAHSKVITSVAQAPGSGNVLTSSLDPDLGGDNQYVRVWKLLDLDFAQQPTANDKAWVEATLVKFLKRHGDAVDSLSSRPKGDDLELSFVGSDVEPVATEALVEHDPHVQFAKVRAALLAEPRSPQRNLDLAMAYLVADNRKKARDYLNRVCRFGGADLIQDLEAMFLVAESLLKDGLIDEAVPWLLRTGEQDHADALLQLGLLSMSGKGMPRDEKQGVSYFRRSAEHGNMIAAYNLGAYHEHIERGELGQTNWRKIAFGDEPTRPPDSLVRAFEWYERAAEAECAPAQIRMGDFFATGQIVGRDLAAAREWYARAASQGHEAAEEKLANLEKIRLTE